MDILLQLQELIEQNTEMEGVQASTIPHLSLYRYSRTTEPLYAGYEPSVCVVSQGRKQTIAGEGVYDYGAGQCVVATVDIPVVGQVTQASAGHPFLALLLKLDAATIGELLAETGLVKAGRARPESALGVSQAEPALLDACVRLLRLLDTPQHIRVMAPLIQKEIHYRLLHGVQGARIRQIVHGDKRLQNTHRAIAWIRRNYKTLLSIEQLSEEASMSASSLYEHFKAVTGMSPLQYQKHLRLQEARRLMLSESVDAAAAGFSVGYGSPSQFSREYRRLFGAPPIRDIANLRTHGNLTGTRMARSGVEAAMRGLSE